MTDPKPSPDKWRDDDEAQALIDAIHDEPSPDRVEAEARVLDEQAHPNEWATVEGERGVVRFTALAEHDRRVEMAALRLFTLNYLPGPDREAVAASQWRGAPENVQSAYRAKARAALDSHEGPTYELERERHGSECDDWRTAALALADAVDAERLTSGGQIDAALATVRSLEKGGSDG